MHRKIVSMIFASTLFIVIFASIIPSGHSIKWSPDMRLTWESGFDVFPSITQTDDGLIWVVWASDRTGNFELFYKVYNESMVHPWSPEARLTENIDEDLTPCIMQAQDGTIWVVWSSKRAGNNDVYFKTYNGSAWSPDKPLTTDPNRDDNPCIIQTTDGTIWVVWASNRTEQLEIHYATSSDNGETWTEKPLTKESGLYNRDPAAMQAANGTIWAVWERDGDIYYSLYNGTSWSSMKPLITVPNRDVLPSIMQAQDETIWLAWTHYREVAEDEYDLDIYYSIYNGTSWSEETRLTTDPGPDKGPSLLQAQDGTIWIAWSSNRLQATDIYYRTDSTPPENDVAIFSIKPSETLVVQGKNVSIKVVSQNKGTLPQTFNVSCYADSILIGNETVAVDPGQLNITRFQWDTSGVPLGTYTIEAVASTVTGETYTADNTLINGNITIGIRNVAVKDVAPSQTVCAPTQTVNIHVVVKNEGNFTETFNVTVYRNTTAIRTKTVSNLTPNAEITLTFKWYIYPPYGNYTIWSRASQVADENETNDNSLTDGTVVVTILADVNGDGVVDMDDCAVLNAHWYPGPPIGVLGYHPNADINQDGKVDLLDGALVNANWGKSR